MLFCGALKRSNNPYMVETSVSKNQKEILTM